MELTVISLYYYFLLYSYISSFIKERRHRRFMLQKFALWAAKTTTTIPKTKGYCRGAPSNHLPVSVNTRWPRGGQQTGLKSPHRLVGFSVSTAIVMGWVLSPAKDVAVLAPRTSAYNLIWKQHLCRWPRTDEAISVGSDPTRLSSFWNRHSLPQAEPGENPGTSLPGAFGRSLALLTL